MGRYYMLDRVHSDLVRDGVRVQARSNHRLPMKVIRLWLSRQLVTLSRWVLPTDRRGRPKGHVSKHVTSRREALALFLVDGPKHPHQILPFFDGTRGTLHNDLKWLENHGRVRRENKGWVAA